MSEFDPKERNRPPREEGWSEETEEICEIIKNRGDQRIGQLLSNAISQKVEFDDGSDAESLEEAELVRYKNRAKVESYLWNIEAPELLKLLEELNDQGDANGE